MIGLISGVAVLGGILGNHFAKQWGLSGFQQILLAGAFGGVFGGIGGGLVALFQKKRNQ